MAQWQIANYWMWGLENAKLLGMAYQILAVLMLISLWWHQDRAWRIVQWFLCGYAFLVGITRYGQWLIYGLFSPAPESDLRGFIIKSGIIGLLGCVSLILILVVGNRNKWMRFDHFSPEDWKRKTPTASQWFGLVLSLLALWSPFVPDPAVRFGSTFTLGFPTSFGVTITPVLIFICGLLMAGSRNASGFPLIFLGASIILVSIAGEPSTFFGFGQAATGLALGLTGLFWITRQSSNNT